MSTPLLESLQSLFTPATIGPLAGHLGESEAATGRGLQAAGTSILAGLVSHLRDSGSMRQLFDLIGSRANDPNLLDSPSSYLGGGLPTGALADLGQNLLSAIFGGRIPAVGDTIARTAGLRAQSASTLLSMAAPLVMALLGRRIKRDRLDVTGLTSLLAGEKDEILRAAPAGLGSLLGLSDIPRVGAGVAAGGAAARPATPRWVWPAVATLAVIALVLYMGRDRTVPEPISSTMGDDAVGAMSEAAAAAADATGRLGAAVSRRLADGLELVVPERGIESRVIAFIEDPNRPVDRTTWFEFDRLTFETASAAIRPESQEQLDNIAAILRAYPAVRFKIGGYTDNTGDRTANLKLSQDRADAVRDALIAKGIDGSRLEAEGYGDQFPLADNSTEEGRARNRRIALRVTAK